MAPLLAFLLDLLFGDPIGRWHPVCLMGKLIAILDRKLYRREDAPEVQFRKGIVLCLCVLLAVTLAGLLLFLPVLYLGKVYALIVGTLLADSCLAAGDLKKESLAVTKALREGGTDAGRKAVSRIVGRDTQRLDEEGVLRAAVETVAESTTDGELAPLFYLLLLGPLCALLYKAINTMDSMLGYKNERYLYFGRAAARLDDAANFLPSRIAALLSIVAALFMKDMSASEAFRIWKRDRRKHESPNSAQTESAFAGALGLKLAGPAYYFGKRKEKEWIGDARKAIDCEDVARADRLMMAASFLGLLFGLLLRGVLLFVFVSLFSGSAS
ncbi:MAG: cobalamin biosynthesis protein CobD [Lachnospiraceae bacterium]|nr:cobalamin biosynthesis protein CobD [Lachnospiraceae bacterium]